jgi:hypothetical protein
MPDLLHFVITYESTELFGMERALHHFPGHLVCYLTGNQVNPKCSRRVLMCNSNGFSFPMFTLFSGLQQLNYSIILLCYIAYL